MPDSILVIENDPTLRRELVSALAKAGFTTVAAPDYSAALLKLDNFKPDMVIVGGRLTGMESMEVCRQIHSALDIPVVLLGEDYSDEAWKKALQAEADLYQAKPFNYLILVARVKATLRRCKARWRQPYGQGSYPPKAAGEASSDD